MWTNNQQMAIDASVANNLVSAAAGSGKTAVMVERISQRVLAGLVDIDRLLVVTFTNAAASELKSRLVGKIMDSLEKSENPDRLNKQLMLVNTASICTIDSFCLNILRSNFYRLDLDPSFKIADTAELELIKSDVLNKIFEEYYEADDKEFINLVNCYTTRKDTDLFELILKLYAFTNPLPGGVDLLGDYIKDYSDNSVWEKYFTEKVCTESQKAISYYDDALKYCPLEADYDKLRTFLEEERSVLEMYKNVKSWDDAVSCTLIPKVGNFPVSKKFDYDIKEKIKGYRDLGKKIKTEIDKIFKGTYAQMVCDLAVSQKSLEKLFEITTKFSEAFTARKSEAGMVDFTDVEQYALKLLSDEDGKPSKLAHQLMDRYDEIYVDEYQDCNALQEKIFTLISGIHKDKPNMFMVGDMKQSIYGFRGSEPGLFKEKADTYMPYCEDGKYNRILLNKNFRSRKSIIDGVNSVFSQIMSEKCGQLNYDEDEFLYYNEDSYEDVNSDTDKIDIVLFETKSDLHSTAEDEDSPVAEIQKTEAEAIYTANRIKEIVNGSEPYMVFDKKTSSYRRARYADIVVLLRSQGEKAETFNRIFELANIPVYYEGGESYYNTPEIAFLLAFLRIIDNPLDDIALLTVMRHPVFSFNEDDFVSIRLCKPKGFFYSSVRAYVGEHDDELSQKLRDFLGKITEFYEKSKYLTTDKLIWDVVCSCDYMSYLSFLSNSDLRKANVKSFIYRAYEFEKTSYKGIFDFIRYIDSVKKSGNDKESAKTLSEDENVVRIMSIHKSKGLEFPVVFLCDAAKKFNESDISASKVIMDSNYGFGLNFYDYANRYSYPLPRKIMLKELLRRKMLSEEMRIFYVALTRAREKLYVVGSIPGATSHISKLSEAIKNDAYKLDGDTSAVAGSYMDWMLISVLRNENVSLFDHSFGYRESFNNCDVFRFTLMHKNDAVLDIGEKANDTLSLDIKSTAEEKELVNSLLGYTYPMMELSEIPSNMSVTELKRRELSEDVAQFYHRDTLPIPSFASGQVSLTAAAIGTCTHLVMEKLDISCADDEKTVKMQIEKLKSDGFLTEEEAKSVNPSKISRIFTTDAGRLMRQYADSVVREFSFKYLMPVKEIFRDYTGNENMVIQGTVDAYFELPDGGIVIVDYKTDKIRNGTEDIIKKYSPQLKYYKIALEKALDKKVKNTYLFLLDTGEAVECI